MQDDLRAVPSDHDGRLLVQVGWLDTVADVHPVADVEPRPGDRRAVCRQQSQPGTDDLGEVGELGIEMAGRDGLDQPRESERAALVSREWDDLLIPHGASGGSSS